MTRTGMVETPLGTIRIDVEDGAVVAIHLPPHAGAPKADGLQTPAPTEATESREAAHPEPVEGRAAADADAVVAEACRQLEAAHPEPVEGRAAEDADPVVAEACRQLAEYFEGKRTAFELPLRPAGTPFQQAVWVALRAIPAGETRSYADIARAVGRPSAVRAVGAANGANPIAIVVPCHRVIGSSGALTGYAGGLPTKKWLLAFEGRLSAPLLRLADASRR